MRLTIPEPREFYQVEFAGLPSTDLLLPFARLYLPLIGKEAFSLYLALFSQSATTGKSEVVTPHDLLFQSVHLSGALFEQARQRLEGVALVQTFVKQSFEFGKEYVYRLKSPLSFSQFFAEPLFSGMLLSILGQHAFDRLVEECQGQPVGSFQDLENVSKKFTDVYAFDLNVLAKEDQRLNQAKQKMDASPVMREFDVEFFQGMLTKQGLSLSSEEDWAILRSLHSLFDLTELELFDKVVTLARAGSVLEVGKLSEHLQEKKANISKEEQERLFSPVELKIIEEAEQTKPTDYLENIHLQTGGKLTRAELDLLVDLEKRVNEAGASVEILNVLMNYVLVIQRHSSLPRKYLFTIVEDWLKQGVFSAVAAVLHLREKVENSELQEKKRNQRFQSFGRKVEKVPEWKEKRWNAQESAGSRGNVAKEKQKATPEEVERLRQRLAAASNFSKN